MLETTLARRRLLFGRRHRDPADVSVELFRIEASAGAGPALRCKLEESLARPVRQHPRELAEVDLGVERVELCRGDQCHEVRSGVSVVVAATEQPGLAPDGDCPQCALGAVVVHHESAIANEGLERITEALDAGDDAGRRNARKAEPCERAEALTEGIPRSEEHAAIDGSLEDGVERPRLWSGDRDRGTEVEEEIGGSLREVSAQRRPVDRAGRGVPRRSIDVARHGRERRVFERGKGSPLASDVLVAEDAAGFTGTGGADGKLPALGITPYDPRPTGTELGLTPQDTGLDRAATYRGAFENGAPALWTTGWTAGNAAGLIAD